jgi:hypothetical protein
VNKNDYYLSYEVRFAQIPAWADLSPSQYRQQIREIVDEIVKKGRIARDGRKPLGAKQIMQIPLIQRSELPPQPWFEDRRRMICWADPRAPETRDYLDRYWAFQRAFRAASTAFREGELGTDFPPGAFRPITYRRAPPRLDQPPALSTAA